MAYQKLLADIPANWFSFQLTPGLAFGSALIGGTLTPPNLPNLDLILGTGAGKIDIVGLFSATLTNVTPGTTDTLTVDLKNLVDPAGAAITTMVKLVAILTLNYAQDDVSYLTLGPGASNPLTSMFSGVGGVLIGPAYQSANDSAWRYGFDARVAGNPAAYAVSTTVKTIKYTSGSSVLLPMRGIVLGRTA